MPRVLIITYYWPPSGGSAVLRWLKFTKYLREYGWEPVIYTPLNPEPNEFDESLLNDIPEGLEIVKRRIIEPYSIYKFLTGRRQRERLGVALMSDNKRPGILSRISLWIRSNFFIPDPRMLWINPSVKFLCKYLNNNPVDIIVSTGPPHSMHLIALKIKEITNVKWVADFRDPWTNIDFYKELKLTSRSDHRHRKLEAKVLKAADQIISVSPGMTEEFSAKGIQNICTITNGYDSETRSHVKQNKNEFTIIHLGSMPESRNPEIFWKALESLINENSELKSALKIRLIGRTDFSVKDSIKNYKLQDFVQHESYIPHDIAQAILSEASILLLCINNTENAAGILTNKFFEYLSAHRPIVAIGPVNGDAGKIIKETGAGRIFEYNDFQGLKEHLAGLFYLYSQNRLILNSKNIEKYSRRNLTGELVRLFNSLISR